jgi:hypothetical protein
MPIRPLTAARILGHRPPGKCDGPEEVEKRKTYSTYSKPLEKTFPREIFVTISKRARKRLGQ